jgi:uncharacterized protein YhaN
MLSEIANTMRIAGRVGYEVGRQIQVDRALNEWANYANFYRAERDEARSQRSYVKKQLEVSEQQADELRAQVARLKKEDEGLRAQVARLNKENEGLSADVLRLYEFKKDALIAMKAQIEESKADKASIDASKRKATAALQQVELIKKAANEQIKQLVEKLNLQSNRLTATWARLTGAERVLGRLVSEVVDRAPTLQLEMLSDTQRRIVLLNAWTEVVKSKARYEPALKFTFEPLPI